MSLAFRETLPDWPTLILFTSAIKAKGKLDVVFANAGVAEFAPLGKITEEHFDRLFGINVKGTLFTVQKPFL